MVGWQFVVGGNYDDGVQQGNPGLGSVDCKSWVRLGSDGDGRSWWSLVDSTFAFMSMGSILNVCSFTRTYSCSYVADCETVVSSSTES
jgi:hypothetical protein